MTETEPFVRWEWVFSHLDEVWARTLEHLQLTGLAVGIGFVLAMLLSIVALRFRWTYSPITWFAGILYTIPSIAVFALLVPVTGLTITTAEVGLVSYTLLILVRNIVAGIDGVPDAAREAAVAMGFRRWRLLARIEIPLALPVIIAGLRIATMTTVGLVTVTSLIGQGGYGAFINDGLRRFFNTPLVLGAALSVALAVALDVLLVVTERALTPWVRRRVV
jgi:osmoprotectant transport system permease protein